MCMCMHAHVYVHMCIGMCVCAGKPFLLIYSKRQAEKIFILRLLCYDERDERQILVKQSPDL